MEKADRAMGVLIEMTEVHPSEPHWYLEGLGTHPDWKGADSPPKSWPRCWAIATPTAFPPT